jgi:pimeloyl-ACP methyl ester carboxylesterase
MQQPEMIRAKGDGVQIQLAQWNGAGKTVIAVHGLTANCRCWDVIAQTVAAQHRFLAVDLRGRGRSDKPPTGYSEAHHIRDLLGVMNDLGLDRAVLIGHSLGGYITMGFAARYPERVEKLILIDAGGELSQEHWDRVSAAIKPAIDRLEHRFASTEAFLDLMRLVPFFNPWSEAIESYLRYDVEPVENGVRSRIQPAHIREEVASKRSTGAAPFYPKLSCPVLILRATDGIFSPDDILLPADAVQQMLREIPDARCKDITGTNHYSILFQPNAERDRAILAFLKA